MEIYVIRHTQVAVGKDVCYGQSDVPLADSFLEEVVALKEKLPTDIELVFSSPMPRCQNLVRALGYKNARLESALQEMNFGDWEGKKWNDLPAEPLRLWMENFVETKTPNGENLAELFERVATFIDDLAEQPPAKVLLVTHAGVIRCLWAYLLEIPLENIFKIPIAYGEIFSFDLQNDASRSMILNTK